MTKKPTPDICDSAGAMACHPLLGQLLDAADLRFENAISADAPWFIDQHRVFGVPMLPGAAMVEWALAALRALTSHATTPSRAWVLEGIAFEMAMRFSKKNAVRTQTLVERNEDKYSIRCLGREAAEGETAWSEHARVRSGFTALAAARVSVDLAQLRNGMTERSVDGLYEAAVAMGIGYGPAFQGIRQIWRGGSQVLTRIDMPEAARDGNTYLLHPVVLDACFQSIAGFMDNMDAPELPVSIERITIESPPGTQVWCCVTDVGSGNGSRVVHMELFADSGERLVEIRGLRFKTVKADVFDAADDAPLQFYQTRWQVREEAIPSAAPGSDQAAPWLLFCPDRQQALDWQNECVRLGYDAVTVSAGACFEQYGQTAFCVDPHAKQDVSQLFSTLRAGYPEFAGLLFNGARRIDATTEHESHDAVVDRIYALTQRGFFFLQHFLSHYAENEPDIIAVSHRAYGPDKARSEDDLAGSVLTGMIKAVIAEYPRVRCVQVDLDENIDGPIVDTIIAHAAALGCSGHLALRDGRCFEARLCIAEDVRSANKAAAVYADASYLITGGWGGIGLSVAAWLIERGARSLVLTGRTLPSDTAAIDVLRASGAQVTTLVADVADAAAMERVFDHIQQHLPPLRGIVHAAGATEDRMLGQLEWPQFAAVLEPKVRGAWNLHRLAKGLELDFVVFFSALASLLGTAGQFNYVVANGFLDALAHYRHGNGTPGLSINWGFWADVGMAAKRNLLTRAKGMGLHGIDTDEGMASFGRLLAVHTAQMGVARIDWERLLTTSAIRGTYGFLADVESTVSADYGPARDLSGLADMEHDAAHTLILDELFERLTLALGMDVGKQMQLRAVFPQSRLNNLGLDSLMAIQMRSRLLKDLGVNIGLQPIMGGATADEIADMIIQQVLLRQLMLANAPSASEDIETEML